MWDLICFIAGWMTGLVVFMPVSELLGTAISTFRDY